MRDLTQKFNIHYMESIQENSEKPMAHMQNSQEKEGLQKIMNQVWEELTEEELDAIEAKIDVEEVHRRMEEQMEKELAEIEARLAARPEITCQPVSPKIKERIDAKLNGNSL